MCTCVRVAIDENVMEAEWSHTKPVCESYLLCYKALIPAISHVVGLGCTLCAGSSCWHSSALENGGAVWALHTAKQQSQTAGKVLATLSAFSGRMSIWRKQWMLQPRTSTCRLDPVLVARSLHVTYLCISILFHKYKALNEIYSVRYFQTDQCW